MRFLKTMAIRKLKITLLSIILFYGFLLFSCKKNPIVNYPIKIGAKYQGGLIAYILQPGNPGYDPNEVHGLIAAPQDQSPGIKWDDHATFIKTSATENTYGSGKSNTEIIVQILGTGNYAAKLCADLKLGGYNDWYLPSKDELEKLYAARNSIGGFSLDMMYWSSSEATINTDWVWRGYFGENAIAFGEYTKDNQFRVRAVRDF